MRCKLGPSGVAVVRRIFLLFQGAAIARVDDRFGSRDVKPPARKHEVCLDIDLPEHGFRRDQDRLLNSRTRRLGEGLPDLLAQILETSAVGDWIRRRRHAET